MYTLEVKPTIKKMAPPGFVDYKPLIRFKKTYFFFGSTIQKIVFGLPGYTMLVSGKVYVYPRHRVIPPEVWCLIGMFLGSNVIITFSGGVLDV